MSHKKEEQEETTWITYEVRRNVQTESGEKKPLVILASAEVPLSKLKGRNLTLSDIIETSDIDPIMGFADEINYATCHKCHRPIYYPEGLEDDCPKGGKHEVPIPPAYVTGEDPEQYMDKVWDLITNKLQQIRNEELAEEAAKAKNPEIQKSATGWQKVSPDKDTHRIRLTFLPPTFQKED